MIGVVLVTHGRLAVEFRSALEHVVGLLVDLAAADAERLPETERQHAVIAGLSLPRLAIAAGAEALPAVLEVITSGGFEGAVLAFKPSS